MKIQIIIFMVGQLRNKTCIELDNYSQNNHSIWKGREKKQLNLMHKRKKLNSRTNWRKIKNSLFIKFNDKVNHNEIKLQISKLLNFQTKKLALLRAILNNNFRIKNQRNHRVASPNYRKGMIKFEDQVMVKLWRWYTKSWIL